MINLSKVHVSEQVAYYFFSRLEMGSIGVQAFGDEENISNGTRVQPLSSIPKQV